MAVRATLAMLLLSVPPAAPVAAPPAAPAPGANVTLGWACTHSMQLARGRLDVTRNLDAEGRPEYDYLFWQSGPWNGRATVGWQRLDAQSSAILPWRVRTDMILAPLTLTRPVQHPVWLVLRIDGRISSRRLLPQRMSDLPEFDPERMELLGSFMAGSPRPVPVPDVTDESEVLVTVEEEGGETLARYAVALPGRDVIDEVVARAVPALEAMAADFRNRCRADRGQGRVH
ncbi:MAG TPA: hypothetical protein VEC11_04730 [Allosphingosinicella sp.]|nr:hypothetical protein [Allosphingosinicella sp.]